VATRLLRLGVLIRTGVYTQTPYAARVFILRILRSNQRVRLSQQERLCSAAIAARLSFVGARAVDATIGTPDWILL
jgi:hypothetical protein